MTNEFDSIPDHPPLPNQSGGEGFGVSEDTGTTVKAADLVDEAIAIVGYLRFPNQFKETEKDPEWAILYEVMDAQGNHKNFWHSSNTLRKQVEARDELDQIPFRTTLEMRDSKKGNTSYYTFA